MIHTHLRSTAVLGTMLVTSWTFVAGAQQQPGSNVPTPPPTTESNATTPTTTALHEPVIDARTERSTFPNKPLLVGSGVLQGLGAASMLLSLVIPKTTTREWYLIGDENVLVAPLVGMGELGAVAAGTF